MTGKKKALGRGLDALFGEMERAVPVSPNPEDSAVAGSGERAGKPAPGKGAGKDDPHAVRYIDIDLIRPNEAQPRMSFDSEKIADLAESVKTYGMIQPVVVKTTELGYELIAGERRWRAARVAGLREIPALLREVTEQENAILAIIENMQREDLNPIEEATAFRIVIDKHGMTQEELSRVVGKSRPYITNTLRLLKLPESVIEALKTGALMAGHANALGSVKDPGLQEQLAAKIIRGKLTIREAERLCADAQTGRADRKRARASRAASVKSQEIRQLEEELTTTIGVKVNIAGDEDGGNVELRYFDRAGLDEIIELLRMTGDLRK